MMLSCVFGGESGVHYALPLTHSLSQSVSRPPTVLSSRQRVMADERQWTAGGSQQSVCGCDTLDKSGSPEGRSRVCSRMFGREFLITDCESALSSLPLSLSPSLHLCMSFTLESALVRKQGTLRALTAAPSRAPSFLPSRFLCSGAGGQDGGSAPREKGQRELAHTLSHSRLSVCLREAGQRRRQVPLRRQAACAVAIISCDFASCEVKASFLSNTYTHTHTLTLISPTNS